MADKEVETEQANRALEEARKRHYDKNANHEKMPLEKNGRGGLEPTRYGDWEVKGITSDF